MLHVDHVRFGVISGHLTANIDVRFAPESGHWTIRHERAELGGHL
jgi:hypothetical protein